MLRLKGDHDISILLVSLVWPTDSHINFQDSISAYRFCVCKLFDITVRQPQNALMKATAIVLAKATYIAAA